MIVPSKYVRPEDSIIYLSAKVIKYLENKKYNIVDLWFKVKAKNEITYNKFIQILIYLYTTGIITYTENGEIYNENIKS